MGIPTDPADNGYETGEDCQECWGEGLPFSDVPTPKYVVATFTEVVGCNGGWAPDGSYTLTQLPPPHSCTWKKGGIQWRIFAPTTSEVFVSSAGPPLAKYFNGIKLGCHTEFGNLYDKCDSVIRAKGGSCKIT